MLKPLPQENSVGKGKKKKTPNQSVVHSKPSIIWKIHRIGEINDAAELKNMHQQVSKYISNQQQYDINEMTTLIHSMQKALIQLEKKRIKLIKEEHLQRKSKKTNRYNVPKKSLKS